MYVRAPMKRDGGTVMVSVFVAKITAESQESASNIMEGRMCENGEYEYTTVMARIDKCLVPLIKTLHEYGIKTVGCCCGHDEIKGNNRLLLAVDNVAVGLTRNNDDRAMCWKYAKDCGIHTISIPIIKQ